MWLVPSEDDKKNPIVASALQIQDEGTSKFSYNGGDARSAENAALQEKFETHERLIMKMKAEIKNLQADPPAPEGNDLNKVGGYPFEKNQCEQVEEKNVHGDLTTTVEADPCDVEEKI